MKTTLTKTRLQLSTGRKTNGNGGNELVSAAARRPKLDIKIDAPNMKLAVFKIIGTTMLVVHRFSAKAKQGMIDKMVNPPKAGTRAPRKPLNPEALYNEARYRHKDGWDGFNASAVRCAIISACRLCGFKMTIAKLSIFTVADGLDKDEPQYNLVRIFGTPARLDSIGRLANGSPIPIYRPSYFPWHANLRISFDADQLSHEDVTNLLHRVGTQVGLCEGRHDSKDSAGQGWGCFMLAKTPGE